MTAVCSGVALAVVTCFSPLNSTPAYADFGDFGGTVDYILSATGSDALFITTPGGAFVAGAVIGIYLCTRDPLVSGLTELSAESISFGAGYYNWNSELHTVYSAVYAGNGTIEGDPRCVVCQGTDFTVTAVLGSDVTSFRQTSGLVNGVFTFNYQFTPYVQGQGYFTINSPYSDSLTVNLPKYYTDFLASVRYRTSGDIVDLASKSNAYLASACTLNGPSPFLSVLQSNGLPSGLIDPAHPELYIENTLRPYVEINYPDYIYLLPEPEPEPPQYATDDIVPGIPKDWTIINPELPTSPHLDLTIPDGDFQDIDPGDTFTGFASGVGFWWAMVDQFLTTFHIKALALALLAVAVAIFALYKIGG